MNATGDDALAAVRDDLDGSLAEAWRRLVAGAGNDIPAFRTPTLATVDRTGAPSARTVILREADPVRRRLQVHTDRRSAKFAELLVEPRVSLHFYDPAADLQLRVAGVAELHAEDDVAAAAWEASGEMTRAIYRVEPTPATPLRSPYDADAEDHGDPETGRRHFAVLRIAVASLEWLYLSRDGHRRARFDWTETDLDARWLAP